MPRGTIPMSYTRVWVIENTIPFSEGMKFFRKHALPALNAAKKASILKNIR